MDAVNRTFSNIEKLTREDGQREFLASLYPINKSSKETDKHSVYNTYELQATFLRKIIKEIDNLSVALKQDDTILISVKNQKLLRTCYQILTSLGISQCLIPGLGIKLTKRCLSAVMLPSLNFTDEQKYEILTECTDFFYRSYNVPVLKKIILTLHLSDYLAALIQLSFAPLKKPGKYKDFIMTQELHDKLNIERQKYVQIYEYLVNNCFQPTLMKELLVLQSVTDPPAPMFVKRVISKELSRRLLAPGGLLSLIRCFMESYDIDTGFDWKKIDMITKIVSAKHGSDTEMSYLNLICSQLIQILSLNNTHFLTTAIACILSLNEKFPQAEPVKTLMKDIFQAFDYDCLIESASPGTIILTPQEIEHKINILHASMCSTKLEIPFSCLLRNVYILFNLGMKCTKNDDLKIKLKDIILKCFEQLEKVAISGIMKDMLFGKELNTILVEEFDAGLTVKYTTLETMYSKEKALEFFLYLFKSSNETMFLNNVFEASLQMLIEYNVKRKSKMNRKTLLSSDDVPVLFDNVDEEYMTILQLLSETVTSPKIISSLKICPAPVLNFVEHFILKSKNNLNDECVTIALVLLNTILSNSKTCDMEQRFSNLIPVLKVISEDKTSVNSVLCQESLDLITSKNKEDIETPYKKALSDVFDSLLPVRAHGLIALTKLIEAKDTETVSKKHYVFCLFQEQLKDTDSYIYLSAINGIASLGTHCTEDVLHVLCKEFLETTMEDKIETIDDQSRIAEIRMKIGDIIVKVTKRLGEMAVKHKTILLNTMLCGCRDEDPMIRTSALSNLAEICLVLHYKMGTIIYEVLHCIFCILETDKVIECRRAAVMIISSLFKGLGKEVLIELKDSLLPIYRSLKNMYNDNSEDSVLRLHAQLALEELNDIVNQFLFPEVTMEKQIFVLDKPNEIFKQ